MNKFCKSFLITSVLVFFSMLLSAQSTFRYGYPVTKSFSAKDYNGHPQVWTSYELSNGEIIFGTSSGVIFYNGSNFREYFKGIIFRTFYEDTISHRIYYGGDNSFGYIYQDSIGNYYLKSLSDDLPKDKQDFMTILGIHSNKDYLYFSGYYRFFVYKGDSLVKTFKPKTNFRFLFNPEKDVFYTFELGRGLLKVMSDTLLPVAGNDFVAQRGINAISQWNDSTYLVAVASPYQLYFYNKNTGKYSVVSNFPTVVKTPSFVKILKDKKIAVGTLTSGVFLLNKDFSIYTVYNASNGLPDNNIASLNQDRFGNVWITTLSGIGVIYDYNGTFEINNKQIGLNGMGTFLDVSDTSILVALSNGLFEYNLASTFSDKLIKFNKAYLQGLQVLFMQQTKFGDILVATNKGVYQYRYGKVNKVFYHNPTLYIRQSEIFPNVAYASTLAGIIVLEYSRGKWNVLDTIDTRHIFRQIWEKDAYSIYSISEINTLYKIKSKNILNNSNNSFDIKELKTDTFFYFRMNDTIFGLKRKEVYFLDFKTDSFVKLPWEVEMGDGISKYPVIFFKEQLKRDTTYITSCGETFTKFRISGTHIYISNDDYLGEKGSLIYAVDYDSARDVVWGISIDKILNVPRTYHREKYKYSTIIYSVSLTNDSLLVSNGIMKKIELPYKNNSIRFVYGAVFYRNPKAIEYSYKLQNFDSSWSKYSNETFITYTNLPPGTYTFKVKARNIYGEESKIAKFNFTILPPWYMTWWAYTLFFIIVALLIYLIVRFYTYRLKQQNIRLEKIVKDRTAQLRKKNKVIMDSIHYAKKIQDAILPFERDLKRVFPESFIIFRPRDIVSGDFFWFYQINKNETILALADCTGHGVPGAFMSMIGNTLLNEVVKEKKVFEPDKILEYLHLAIISSLQKTEKVATANDGMDIVVCKINTKEKSLRVASASQNLFVFLDNKFITCYGDPYSIGDPFAKQKKVAFKPYDLHYNKSAMLYLTSDGYYDQFGGEYGRKLTIKRFLELLKEVKDVPIEKQKQFFIDHLEKWRGDLPQLDDILLIGIKLH